MNLTMTRTNLAFLMSLLVQCLAPADEPQLTDRRIGYTEFRTNLPGGRHANVRTMRAVTVKANGGGRQLVARDLVDDPDAWTQFVGWSPDGEQAIVYRGWQDPENAQWEEQHRRFFRLEARWCAAVVRDATFGSRRTPTYKADARPRGNVAALATG